MATQLFINSGTFVDVTSYVHSLIFKDNGQNALNKLTVNFKRNIITTDENPSDQVEVKLIVDDIAIFGGKVEKPVSDFPLYSIIAYSYGSELLDKFENTVYENQPPEDIAKSIVETDTDLVYASTATSGITIEKIVFKDKKKSECLGILSSLLGWSFRTDINKKAYFEPPGTISSGLSLVVGTNVFGKPVWDYNPDWVISKVIVEGGKQQFFKTETFATGTFVTLAYEPSGTVQVFSDGVELNPTVDGALDGDYTVDASNGKILFNATGTNPSVNYSYLVPIRIEQVSQVTTTKKELKIENKSIKSFTEARKIGRDLLASRQVPKKSTKLPVYGFNSNLIAGYLINVQDEQETDTDGIGINENFVISQVDYKYPEETTIITVNTNDYLLYDMMRDIDEKLRQLSQDDTDTSIIQQYKIWFDNVNVSLDDRWDVYTRTVNDSWIWGDAIWGITKWGDRREGDNFKSYDVISSILVAHFMMNGSVSDSSATGLTTISETDISYVTGKINQTGTFNGTSSKAVIQHDDALNMNDTGFTIASWIYLDSDGVGSSRRIFSNGTTSSTEGYIFGVSTTNKLNLTISNLIDGANSYDSLNTLPNDTWVHIAVTWATGTGAIVFYVNGEIDTSVTGITSINDENRNMDLCAHFTSDYFKGRIDDLRIYNRPLVQSDILTIYNRGSGTESQKTGLLSSIWQITGTGTISGNKLSLGGGATAKYLGMDTTTYSTKNIKVDLDYDTGTADSLELIFRQSHTNSFYTAIFHKTNSQIDLTETIGAVTTSVATTSFSFSDSDSFVLVAKDKNIKIRDSIKWLIDTTGTTDSSGEIQFNAVGGGVSLDKVEIYTGV